MSTINQTVSVVNMNKAKKDGKTKAYFTIEANGIKIGRYKIVEGNKGLFVSAPRHKDTNSDKWYDDVKLPNELWSQLQTIGVEHYTKL